MIDRIEQRRLAAQLKPRLLKDELTGRITENFKQPQVGTSGACD